MADYNPDEIDRLVREVKERFCVRDVGELMQLCDQLSAAKAEVERLTTALTKISAIRDSIVGCQGFNFSEHAYPLVAVLDAAGFKGAGYEIASKNLGTLIERATKAEAENTRLAAEVERLTKERDAAMREADRLRHGVGIEGDFVCPNELENTRLAARVRELELTEEEREFIAVIADELTYRGWRKDEDGAVALEVLDRLAKGGR